MKLRLTCNVAGDMRLQCLRDTPHRQHAPATSGGALVCSSKFPEMTTGKSGAPRHGYGSISKRNIFGRAARKTVRCAGAVIDELPRENTVFLTGTLPGSTDAACAALAAWSGWVVATILQWLRDYAPNSKVFGVWEYQKRGALHVHFVVACAESRQASFLLRSWKCRWIRILDSLVMRSSTDVYGRAQGGTHSGHKYRTRTDAQRVLKSVGCYLAKYLSKGNANKRRRCNYPPSRWFFCTRAVRQIIAAKERLVEVSNLPPLQALELFERLGGEIAACSASVFLYSSSYDAMFKGLIALNKPIRTSMIFDFLSAPLRCLRGLDIPWKLSDVAPPSAIASFFSGKLIRAPSGA